MCVCVGGIASLKRVEGGRESEEMKMLLCSGWEERDIKYNYAGGESGGKRRF